jgi:predicted metal-dependent hydrolase
MKQARRKALAGIGIVHFDPSSRARRVNISIRSSRSIRVAVPCHATLAQAEDFVLLKRDWIIKQLDRLRRNEAEFEARSGSRTLIADGEAKAHLKKRVADLAAMYGFGFNRVYIRNQKTRWGSCSGKNNISLNIRLARLPDMLRDYVILHELLHTRIRNHGKIFWRELDRYVGNSRGLRDRLRRIPLE